MDGVGSTYESLRGRPFEHLRSRFAKVRAIAPYGINYLVNQLTLPELSEAVKIAVDEGASELLLLPEQPLRGKGGIDIVTKNRLIDWVRCYRGEVPLSISEAGAQGLSICFPLSNEGSLSDYAHIDPYGVLKYSSFDKYGIEIGATGLMGALENLRIIYKERENENLERFRI